MSGYDEVSAADLMDSHISRPHLKAHKALPRKRELAPGHNSIQISPVGSQEQNSAVVSHGPTYTPTPTLPLTPPGHSLESETETQENPPHDRSNTRTLEVTGNATPTHQLSPPTPDITPPRVVSLLRKREGPNQVQVSMSSRADSFTTAREALSSDDDAEKINQANALSLRPNRQKLPHPLSINTSSSHPDLEQGVNQNDAPRPTKGKGKESGEVDPHAFDCFDGQWIQSSEVSPATSSQTGRQRRRKNTPKNNETPFVPGGVRSPDNSPQPLNRGNSLRDRIQHSEKDTISASVEKFGEEIGWTLPENNRRGESEVNLNYRNSAASTTSTIEAMVIDSPPQKKHTLRHTRKNPSLRSVSSPVPASYNRDPGSNGSNQQHRLHHKSARISDQTRWSVSSDMSVQSNVTSSPPKQKQEKIPVVVIPQRRSSLKSSTTNSRDHSRSHSLSSNRRPTTAPDSGVGSFDVPRHKRRTMSESLPYLGNARDVHRRSSTRGPKIPQGSSSLSAPTSRNNSRAPSIASDTLRHQTQESNTQLPTTQDEPVTPRRVSEEKRKPSPLEITVPPNAEAPPVTDRAVDAVDADGPLISPSLRHTPFQPSIQSLSPGPVEIREAKAVPFFSHNNTSLLLVEQYPQTESRVGLRTLPVVADGKATDPRTPVRSSEALAADVNSPLRNPRPPPKPPAFQVIPPTPLEEEQRQLGQATTSNSETGNGLVRRFGSVKRALSNRRRSETASTIVSTHRVRNRKAGKEIDSRLHPFWRPRGFWDDVVDTEEENRTMNRDVSQLDGGNEDSNLVGNSLGIPHKRAVFEGPLSIIRRVSNRSRSAAAPRRTTNQNGSVSARKYTGQPPRRPHSAQRDHHRRIHTFSPQPPPPRANFLSLRDFQEWLARARHQREQDKLEARRDKLRKSIGGKVLVNNSTAVTPQ